MRLVAEKMRLRDLMRYEVTLDGHEVGFITEADDDEGYIICTLAVLPPGAPSITRVVTDITSGQTFEAYLVVGSPKQWAGYPISSADVRVTGRVEIKEKQAA